MILTKFKIFRYEIPFKSPLKLKSGVLNDRVGLIIQLFDNEDRFGLGEIAPLPGFSDESLEDSEIQCRVLIEGLTKSRLPDKFEYPFIELEENFSHVFPSVQFGVETALIDLSAKANEQRISERLNNSYRQTISINGLLTGEKEEILKKVSKLKNDGYSAVKLKVGASSIDDDIELTKEVRKVIGEDIKLRLDSNRSWSLSQARNFCDSVTELNIEYLEEPLLQPDQLVKALNSGEFAVPIALDETLREILPAELHTFDAVEAIVIKPTLLGLFKSLRFAHQAHAQGITPVISSSYESGMGLTVLAQIAAAVNTEDTAVGLDTFNHFADDIIIGSLTVKMGKINMDNLSDTEEALDSDLLKEIVVS